MKKNIAVAVLIPALLFLFLASARSDPNILAGPDAEKSPLHISLDDAKARARAMKLWEDPLWLTLGHFRHGKSLVDDPGFFLSQNGKESPKEELFATLSAIFDPEADKPGSPASRFPARADFLAGRLGLAPEAAPGIRSQAFEEIFAALSPQSVSLVFASSSMNSPASMFGHTFLVADTASGSRLTAGAINYAALTGETFGFGYAAKGLLGYYKGYYSMSPYHEKIKEYADIAHRDLWEYPANLTPPEIRRMMAHLYELNGIYSDYFFVGENCSLGLLFLLDAARPGLDLVGKTGAIVFPSDTVRIAKEAGMIGDGVLRPSAAEKMRQRAQGLAPAERKLAMDAARGRVSPEAVLADPALSGPVKARVLDLAADALGYLYTAEKIGKDDYVSRFRGALSARSLLNADDPGPPAEGVRDDEGRGSPEQGHRASMLAFGWGERDGKGLFRLDITVAGHGLTDPAPGYPLGSQVLAGRLAIEAPEDGSGLSLERLDLLDLVSLSPRDDLFSPVSWKTRAGYKKAVSGDGKRLGMAEIEIGKGLCRRFPGSGLAYVFLGARADAGKGLDGGWALGPTLEAGILARPLPFLTIHVKGGAARFFPDPDHHRESLSIDASWAVSANAAVAADINFSRDYIFSETTAGACVKIYF
ncbi:MAG: DUF4105 domain-containing protein [Deltaproteobacteria bacterium]|nr:DUF4105 domain-containing protein [Deltaproteobacteria bacterium]